MAGATVIVLYPRKEGATFNKEYYVDKHMPLCSKHWDKYGLKSYEVTELNADGPYSYSVTMSWETHEGFGKAIQDPGTKEIMDDLSNYSSEPPVLLHGPVIKSG